MNNKNYQWLQFNGNHSAAIILGMGPQALFLVRILSEQFETVYLVGKKNWIGYLSRYGKKKIAQDNELKDVLADILERHGNNIPIFVSGGSTLRYYIQNEYLHTLNCYPKPLSALKILNDKAKLYKFVESMNFSMDLLKPITFKETIDHPFPLILKWRSEPDIKIFKTLVINNEREYKNTFIENFKYNENLILQRYIENNTTLAYGAYCLKGYPNCEVVLHHFRRVTNGLSNLVKQYKGKYRTQIIDFCRNIIHYFNYTGFIEFEFIEDKDNDLLYLMECNPRPWGTIEYLKFANNNGKSYVMVNINREIYYLYKSGLRNIKLNLIKRLPHYMMYYKAIWQPSDPLPFFGQIMNAINKNTNNNG